MGVDWLVPFHLVQGTLLGFGWIEAITILEEKGCRAAHLLVGCFGINLDHFEIGSGAPGTFW